MYNGVGLSTPKGSGTCGHVQSNLAALPKKQKHNDISTEDPVIRKPNKEILEHERKRQIEVECMELSDKLENSGYSQEQIDTEVDAYRKRRLEDYQQSLKDGIFDDLRIGNTHLNADIQQKRNAKLEEIFGVSSREPTVYNQIEENSYN